MAQVGSGASKITIVEEQPTLRQIEGEPTAIPGFVGVTERGPVGVATVLTSFEEYTAKFGGDVANGDTSHAVRGFFEEGGQRCWVVRTVHYTNPATPATKTSAAGTLMLQTGATAPTAGTILGTNVAPFNLEPGDDLDIAIDGGAPATATFNATAASRDTSGAGPYVLANNQTLTLSVNGGPVQTVTFLTSEFVDITNATRAEVAAVINAKATGVFATDTGTVVRITTDKRGTGASLNITGGTANGALGFTTGSISGTGNVADIEAVTTAEVETIVEAAVAGCTVTDVGGAVRITSNTTGPTSSVQVQASSTADDELGFDNAVHSGTTGAAQDTLDVDAEDGAYSSVIQIKVADSSSGVAAEFDLQVIDDGVIIATFTNLTMDETGDRYVETVLNDADTGRPEGLTFTDQNLVGTAAQKRPVNGTFGPLSGGSDGLVGLVDADFVGSSVGKTGLYALDLAEEIDLLAVPGRATSTMHNAMISYCEVWRKLAVFAVLDPPAATTAAGMVTYMETTASLINSSEFGAMYWPRVKVLNPNTTVFGADEQITVPPSGIVCGVISRTDSSQLGGIYQPPAGVERGILRSVLGFETDEVLDERKRDLVYPKRVNPLTTQRGQPRYIDGSRTLKGNGNFPYVAERRGVIFIEQSVKRGLEYARHSNNTPELRRDVERTVENFLLLQMQFGAFRSKDPDTAFYVDFGDALNPINVVFAGLLIGRIGLATNKPAEFLELRFTQDTRAFDQAAAS